MSAQRADAAAAGLAATLARMAEVRGGGADGGGDDDGGAKSGPRQISYKQERATHDQASVRECHRPTQRRSQECRAARARRARRRGRATATGRHDQKPRGGGWGEQARLPHHTPGESCADAQASRRRPPDPRPLPCAPAAATRSPPPRRARRRRRPSAHCDSRASLPPPSPSPRDTLLSTRPSRPPRERASVLNRGDPSPIYTRRPGTYKRASAEGIGARGGCTGTGADSDGAAKGRCEQQQDGRSSQQRDGGSGINTGGEETAARGRRADGADGDGSGSGEDAIGHGADGRGDEWRRRRSTGGSGRGASGEDEEGAQTEKRARKSEESGAERETLRVTGKGASLVPV